MRSNSNVQSEVQRWFDGMGPTSSGRSGHGHGHGENLFLALLLDPALHRTAASRIELSRQRYGFIKTPIAAERLHLSLLNFGDYHEAIATAVSQVAATVRFPPFVVTLDTALSFRHRASAGSPFVLTSEHGGDQVRALHRVLHERFTGDARAPSFTPHLTLIWDPAMIPKHPVKRPLSRTVQDFVLVRSYRGKSRYEILDRWPLRPDAANQAAKSPIG
jgi:2'-5' RNA ligase